MLRNICLTVIKPYFKEKSILKILNYSLVHITCDPFLLFSFRRQWSLSGRMRTAHGLWLAGIIWGMIWFAETIVQSKSSSDNADSMVL